MAKDQNGSAAGEEEEAAAAVAARSRSKSIEADEEERSKGSRDRDRRGKSKRRDEEEEEEEGGGGSESSGEDSGERRKRRRKEKERRHRRRRSRSESSGSSSESESESESSYSDSSAERKDKERRKRKEKEKERERKKKEKKKRRKEEKKNLGKKAAVTNSWGKYGIIREVDMWNKRPEFTAWLSEVKQVNLEALSNWEEKQMFKEFMEDHNTATFPSKKYYDLDAYHRRMMEKEKKKGLKNALGTERTVFNDEEQRRLELLRERERQKEEEVAALKRSMQTGMAQAMKEQARLREEMMYQYRLGNFEAAAAIQKRLDPDAPLQ
uniref:Uncharacterized protein n=1 Tax=Oryza punctata TaxID=4537 RepID=A0A0E0KT47_ORYPU